MSKSYRQKIVGQLTPRALIESAFYILDKESKLVPFTLNKVQEHYWDRITPRDIILKARKMGFSTVRLARMIAKCATMENRRCVVVSHEAEATKRLLGRAHHMIDNSKFPIKTDRKTASTITFPDTKSSIWIGTAGAKAFGRGDDITDYHLSELAFYEHPELVTGIEEACVKDSEGCIESTANGWGTMYHRLWTRAVEAKKSGEVWVPGGPRFYYPHFYGWFEDDINKVECPKPLIDLDEYEKKLRKKGISDGFLLWRRLKIKAMFDPEMFPQEYPASPEEAFLVAGQMVFDPDAINRHEQSARKAMWQGEIVDRMGPKLEVQDRGRLKIYQTPIRGEKYIVGGDVSAGIKGRDFSAASVIASSSGEQVAAWHGVIAPDAFADILMLIGAFYNWAALIPEVNNHGLTTCTRIQEAGYPNLYYRSDTKGGTHMGFYTAPGDTGTRQDMINNFRYMVRDFICKVNDPTTLAEMRTFVRLENGKLDHQEGCHADALFAHGIGLWLWKQTAYVPGGAVGGTDRISLRAHKSKGAIHFPNQKGRYV